MKKLKAGLWTRRYLQINPAETWFTVYHRLLISTKPNKKKNWRTLSHLLKKQNAGLNKQNVRVEKKHERVFFVNLHFFHANSSF